MNNIIERKWKQGGMVSIEDLRGTAFQAEELAHTFRIRGVNENGAEMALSGSVGAVFLRADNTDVAITGTVTDGVAVITLPEECYEMPGRFGLTVFLTSGDHTVAIYAAIGSVSRTSSGNVSPGSTENVADLINEINAAIEDLDEAIAAIPQDYQELEDDVSDLKGATARGAVYGTANLLFPLYNPSSDNNRGIHYTWDSNKTVLTVSGELESGYSNWSLSLLVKQDLPAGIVPGGTYHVKYSSTNVPLYIYSHNANRSAQRIFNSKTSGDFTLPSDTEQMDVRFYFASGIQFDEQIDVPVIYNDYANIKLVNDVSDIAADINRNWPTLLFHKDRVPTFAWDGDELVISIRGAIRVDNPGRMSASGTVTGDYRIQAGKHLVYNITAKELVIRNSSSEFLSDDVELLFLTNNSAVLGQWAPYYYIQKTNDEIRADLTTVAIPEYYNDNNYLANRISAINTIGDNLSKASGRMVFVTDYHHGRDKNANMSSSLINKIITETGIRNVVFGGDAYDKEDSPNKAQASFFEFLDMFRPLENRANMFYITGNHEYNNPASDPTYDENMLTMKTIYEMYMGHTPPNVIRIESTNAFYIDDDVSKMRVYFLDCDYSSSITMALRKNMLATLSEVPSGYAVMIFSHTALVSGPAISNRMNQICSVCEAMNDGTSVTIDYTSSDHVNYDFTGNSRTFIGVISGHVHSDGYVYFNGRFPVIATTCDAYGKQTAHPERQPGTIYEQAFDVVQIDVPAKRIYLTRIGCGDDRVFSFGDSGSGLIT